MRILVAGGTGYLGSALVQALRARGDEVLTLTRSTPRANGQVLWDPTSKAMPDSRVLGKPEIVANLCGAPIARRWTKQYRAKLRESRLGPTELLANWVADRPGTSLINGSAIGIYGHDQPETFTEDSPAASDFLGQLVTDWEAATAPANQAGNRVAFARTGIVLATDSPAGAPLCRLAKAGLGGPMGTGQQIWSWISLADQISALLFLIDNPIDGPVNLVAPSPSPQVEVSKQLAAGYGRPAVLPAPSFALRLVLDGFAGELLGSATVSPEVLVRNGFEFRHPSLASLVAWLTAAD